MQSVTEAIQTIARQRGRSDATPLLLMRPFPGIPGERITHLPVDATLSQSWQALTGEPFRPHQAQALMALRKNDAVALSGDNPAIARTAYLLLYAVLHADPSATALVLLPDEHLAYAAHQAITTINEHMPATLRLPSALVGRGDRPDLRARLVLTTPDMLHARLLRHHDRAWQPFWEQLTMVALPEVQQYIGVAAAHLSDLLVRIQRVAALHGGNPAPSMLATMPKVGNAAAALSAIYNVPWRVIAADDAPYDTTQLVIWRGPNDRLRESAELALGLHKQGFHTHIACQQLETVALLPMIGDIPGITIGPSYSSGHVLILAGYTGGNALTGRALRGGYQAVIVALGETLHEQMLARHAETLLSDTPPEWPTPQPNAYATAQHIWCAATEMPLTEGDVATWGVDDLVARLVERGELVELPEDEIAWRPGADITDPYAEFSLRASSGSAIVAANEQNQPLDTLDPTGFERWTFPQAALPVGASGVRVVRRSAESGSLLVRLETTGRRTYPLRRAEVSIREEQEQRQMAGGQALRLGRVYIREEIYAYREMVSAGMPGDQQIKPVLESAWIAPAVWLELAAPPHVVGQMIGWTVAATLPLRTLAPMTELVPAYDPERRRLYFVDAQPGGSGMAAWLYAHAEDVLPLAYDTALACRADPLLEPLARVDMDWLLPMIGRPAEPARSAAANPAQKPLPPERPPKRPVQMPEFILMPDEEEHDSAPEPLVLPRARTPQPEPLEPPKQRTEPPVTRARPVVQEPAPFDPVDELFGPEPPRRAPEPPRPPAEEPDAHQPDANELSPGRSRSPSRANRTQPRYGRVPASARPPRGEQPPAAEPPAPDQRSAPAQPARANQPAPRDPAPDQRSAPAPPIQPQRRAPVPPPEPEPERPPDAMAMIERLRRQRQQRESAMAPAPRQRSAEDSGPIEARFTAGDRVYCLPYGEGTVESSTVEDGREMLQVEFPQHGTLPIDPAVSLVRKLSSQQYDDDLL